MTKNTIKLLDVVALIVDLPEYNLYRGQVGTVVELLAGGALHLKLNLAMPSAGYAYAMAAFMNLLVYAQSN